MIVTVLDLWMVVVITVASGPLPKVKVATDVSTETLTTGAFVVGMVTTGLIAVGRKSVVNPATGLAVVLPGTMANGFELVELDTSMIESVVVDVVDVTAPSTVDSMLVELVIKGRLL